MKNFRNKLTSGQYYVHLLLIIMIIILFGAIAKIPAQTKADVRREIIRQGIQEPQIVLAQCYYETGHLKSSLFKNNKNLFGMKLPKKRETLANGELNGFACFSTWQESIADYKAAAQVAERIREIKDIMNNPPA